jgi:hypothetical protein
MPKNAMTWGMTTVVFAALLVSANVHAGEQIRVCKASHLSASQDRKESDQLDGGLGHHAVTIQVENRGRAPCVLRGVPRLKLFDGAGHRLAAQVCSNCGSYLIPQQPVEDVILQPGGLAYVVIAYNVNEWVPAQYPCVQPMQLQLDASRFPVQMLRTCGEINVTPFLRKPL